MIDSADENAWVKDFKNSVQRADLRAGGFTDWADGGGEMSIKLGDDQNVFWCDECGAEARRTRMEPFPVIVHRPDCPAVGKPR